MSTLSEIYRNTRPPDSDPCERCPQASRCDVICIQRARWWDVAMKKLKEVLNGK